VHFTSRLPARALTSRRASLRETFISSESREETFAEGGEYLPLTVWAAKGFDAISIQSHTKASDIQQHPVLGNCNRVQIRSTLDQKSRIVSRTSQVSVGGTPRAAIAGPAPPLAIEDGRVNDGSNSSSSSSSSGSSSHKKRKRSKKDKKTKKDKKRSKKEKKEKKQSKSKKDMTDAHDLASQMLSSAALLRICKG
jgi:hypothetical protein